MQKDKEASNPKTVFYYLFINVTRKDIIYNIGDLVTYRKDLLGVKGHTGIVINVFTDGDDICYMMVRWHDGEVYPELGNHIVLLARAKNDK